MKAEREAAATPPAPVPALWPAGRLYWRAYRFLEARRPVVGSMAGLHPQPIPLGELVTYGQTLGMAHTHAELEAFVSILDRLDRQFLAWDARSREAAEARREARKAADADEGVRPLREQRGTAGATGAAK